MGFYSHLAKGQSQTSGVDSAIFFLFNLRELVKNGFLVFGRDARTAVLDKKFDLPRFQVPKAYLNCFSRWGIVDGIAQEILQHSEQNTSISPKKTK